ncbi:hypothetical protein [Oceanobacillus bengalensis]|uniref:DUF4064 domain-containing protein n=1 Tax=Oceanobacillus bengalensis TaxID=1435466 RepID=A0A494YZR7_9BACI|nr:hypothetical protein [Oceanobacillus bengalensis]RKQ15683.1 hypothetical protein D8M05_09250 [Oceanobacillus bengalensis]
MNRGLERKLLFTGAGWNLFTALLTIFSYHTWFNNQGAKQLGNADGSTLLVGTHLLDNVSKVILTFGLFMFVASILNFLIAVKLKDNMIQKKVLIWIGIWAAVQLATMDVIGFVIYLLAFVIYFAKNKAIKLSNGVLE